MQENTSNLPFYKDLENHLLKGTYLDIYNGYDAELNGAKYFSHLYGELPFEYSFYSNIHITKFLAALSEKHQLTENSYVVKYLQSTGKKPEKVDCKLSTYFILVSPKILIEVSAFKLYVWYGREINLEEILDLARFFNSFKKKKKHKHRFYMVAQSGQGGFALKKFDVKANEVSIAENYNSDFEPVHQIIHNFLGNDEANGLVMLHGKYGTGKTSYIRHLMSTLNKRFIFFPLYMVDSLSSPSFMPFMSNHKNSILVLEDCEDLLTARSSSGRNNPLVNLLNVSDGLLSDALAIKIICTFNADIKQIDKAILRKGRLVARYEFKELAVEKAQLLASKLNVEDEIKEATTLADIYHMDKNTFIEEESKKIGF